MRYRIYKAGDRFCIGFRYPFGSQEDFDALYWNPKEKSFSTNAMDCWRDIKDENEVLAEFSRLFLFEEINNGY